MREDRKNAGLKASGIFAAAVVGLLVSAPIMASENEEADLLPVTPAAEVIDVPAPVLEEVQPEDAALLPEAAEEAPVQEVQAEPEAAEETKAPKEEVKEANAQKTEVKTTVTDNVDFKDTTPDADYQINFVYDNDDENIESVGITGTLQFYDRNDPVVKDFINTGKFDGAKVYTVYEYKEGMFNTGSGLNNDTPVYQMVKKNGIWQLSLPVPGSLYAYDYVITYKDGKKSETIQDPSNPSYQNSANGHDSGHSLILVGNKDNCLPGQEYIYEADKKDQGKIEYIPYKAADGSTQYIEVYTPKGYDTNKTYKTLYISHGGGGNEAEWMHIGSLKNILDNTIAEGKEPFIVVAMDNTYWKWDYDKIADNFKNFLIPFVERNYSVSKSADDRAMAGLSMGSMTTSTLLQAHPEMFKYYGAFSGANNSVDITDLDTLKDRVIFVTAGNVDMALKNGMGIDSVEFVRRLKEMGVDHDFMVLDGAHDWGFWRDAATRFIKDYLWTLPAEDKLFRIVHPIFL